MTNSTIVVVALADRDAADAACAAAGLGSEIFVAGLSPTGEEPVTHFWCQTDEGARIRSVLDKAGIAYRAEESPDDPEDVFEAQGLRIMPLGPGA